MTELNISNLSNYGGKKFGSQNISVKSLSL